MECSERGSIRCVVAVEPSDAMRRNSKRGTVLGCLVLLGVVG
jgi:hypothetical protein